MTLKVTRAEFLGIDRMDEDELRDSVLDLLAENAKLREQGERLFDKTLELGTENTKLRELATYALKHIIEAECEAPDRERFRGKPCEDCAEYGSSDCPKCMPRMFDVSGIEVDA